MVRLDRMALAAALFLALSPAAYASLGDRGVTVAADQVRLMAQRTTHPGAPYTVEELTLPRGTVVREYLSPTGIVFGVAWQGPAMPNLEQLLGAHMAEARQGASAYRASHGGIGPVSISDGSLVLQSGGHMGSYRGRAYLPSAVPSNVTTEVIK